MSEEIQIPLHTTGLTVYVLVRNYQGEVWDDANTEFTTYDNSNLDDYDLPLSLQTGSQYYTADMPSDILPGTYGIVAYLQDGGSPAADDEVLGTWNFVWGGDFGDPGIFGDGVFGSPASGLEV